MKTTLQEARAIDTPEWTRSWHPLAHRDVIDTVDMCLDKQGIGVVDRKFETNKHGTKLFSSYVLDREYGEDEAKGKWMIGFRNSIDKSMAIGITAGTNVLVCSNMCFHGDYIEFRKHTGHLTIEELEQLTQRAIVSMISRLYEMTTWQTGLRDFALAEPLRKQLTYDAMDSEAIAPSMFAAFNEMYDVEQKIHGDTLYTFHAAGTRTIRDKSLSNIAFRTANLNKVVTQYMEILN